MLSLSPWILLVFVLPGVGQKIGIVTMHTPDILSYANVTELGNKQYADRWGYGFHVYDHIIDATRVPHWSKLHAVSIFMPDYDFLFWIDADAVFYDQSRRLEDVLDVHADPQLEIWAQDIWPDYPSLRRDELIDTGTVLFRNSRWTREFLLELYHYPDCQEYLNWTEQYCFTVAYRNNLLGVRDRLKILPTPTINHHRIPAVNEPGLFIFHYAGRSTKARTRHFKQIHEGRATTFRTSDRYTDFWRFHELFAAHQFGSLASQQVCLFGLGERHQTFLDAMMFHFPYLASFTVIREGAAGLWTQMKASERIGDLFGTRMSVVDVAEYLTGETRKGEEFVKGLFCDIFVLGVESWRHLLGGSLTLQPLIQAGLEPYHGEQRKGFGFSALRDAFFVWLYDGCGDDFSAQTAAATGQRPRPAEGQVLDKDDEDGSALEAACELLSETRLLAETALAEATKRGLQQASDFEEDLYTEGADGSEKALPWKQSSPELWGITTDGPVALGRVPRQTFPSIG